MKILTLHNFYQQAGGEDTVFRAETELLRAYGHEVIHYTKHNDDIEQMSKIGMAAVTHWNRSAYRELRELMRREQPDVMHVHNTFPLISPAAYYAAHKEGVAVVQTLHNYRLLCPSALFFRDGGVCEECLGQTFPRPAIQHACYRGSKAATGAVASMLWTHKLMKTYQDRIDAYILLSQFAKGKFLLGGLPEEKMFIKPNFVVPDPEAGAHTGNFALYVGRLSEEKGIGPLLQAWEQIGAEIPLKIVGAGPLEDAVQAAVSRVPSIEWLGRQPPGDVMRLMGEAQMLLVPSVCYEGFPVTIVEAFAKGLPVVTSELGGMAEIVEHGVTGLLAEAGNADDLAEKVRWLWAHPLERAQMGARAREIFREKYTAEENHRQLLAIYEAAKQQVKKRAGRGAHDSAR